MKIERLLLVGLVLVLAAGMAIPDPALARGGGGKGGGRGGRGGGRGGKGKRGRDGEQMDRKTLITSLEGDLREDDRNDRILDGRKANFEDGGRERREEVLARHRRRGEDARRSADVRSEVSL